MQVFDTVLLIDDDDVSNSINEKIISELGLVKNVISKRNGKEAYEYLTESYHSMKRLPSLILADITMPEMDGLEFVEEIRKSNLVGVKRIPTAILTVSENDSHKDRIEAMGLQFVPKPLNALKFYEIVHTTALHTLSIERQKAILERQRFLEQNMKSLIKQNMDIRKELERIKALREKLELQLRNLR